jgi:hypothetical protein
LEDNKDATINDPLYDDELESTIEKNIHDIIVQQNDILYIKANVVSICLSVCLCVRHKHPPTGPAGGPQQQPVDLWPQMVV